MSKENDMKTRSYRRGTFHLVVGQKRRADQDTWFSISPVRTDGRVKGFGVFGPRHGTIIYHV